MPKGDEVMEVRKLKTVIAGCGKIFPMHAVPVSRDPHAVFTAVCDVKPERAGAAAERFGCRAYTDFEVMLEQEKPDVVHICTPHYLHAPLHFPWPRRRKRPCPVYCPGRACTRRRFLRSGGILRHGFTMDFPM